LRAVHNYSRPGNRLVILDAGDHQVVNAATAELESGSDLILRHAHLLSTEVIHALVDVLQSLRDSLSDQPWVALTVATGQGGAQDELDTQLLRFFARTIAVPPLRHHLDDVQALVPHLLARTGVAGVTLSQAAINQL